jgi:hypothetical protein
MAIKKRIADLSAALTADTRDYEAGMRRAAKVTGTTEATISKTMGKLETVGLKLGLGLVGGGGALSMLTSEIRHVIENIEKIPGVPASTIASVQQARHAFAQTRVGVDQAIAGVVSFTSWSARAAGFVSGALVYGLDQAEQAYWEFGRAAEAAATAQERQAAAAAKAKLETEAAARVIAYATGVQDRAIAEGTAALDREAKAREAYNRRNETSAERMIRLRQEANAVFNQAGMGGTDDLGKRVDAQAKAYDQLTEADKLEKQLTAEAMKHLKVWQELGETISDAGVTQALENNRNYTQEMSEAAKDMGWAFSSAFEDAVLGGEKLSDVLDGVAKDILRIALRSAITEPLGKAIGGFFTGGVGKIFGFAGGGSPPVGQPSLVGERGPELFVPKTAGTVIPNHALGSGGNTYNIDARGADRTGLAQLLAYIRQVDGSIEERSVAANFAAGRRTLARA